MGCPAGRREALGDRLGSSGAGCPGRTPACSGRNKAAGEGETPALRRNMNDLPSSIITTDIPAVVLGEDDREAIIVQLSFC